MSKANVSKCGCVSKSGKNCKRNATYNGCCWQHARMTTPVQPTPTESVKPTVSSADLRQICVCCCERLAYDLDSRYCHYCLKNILDSRDDLTPPSLTAIESARVQPENLSSEAKTETSTQTHGESVSDQFASLKGLARYHAIRNACKSAGIATPKGMKADEMLAVLAVAGEKKNGPTIASYTADKANDKPITVDAPVIKQDAPKVIKSRRRKADYQPKVETPNNFASTETINPAIVPVAMQDIVGKSRNEMIGMTYGVIMNHLDGIASYEKASGKCRCETIKRIYTLCLEGVNVSEAIEAFKAYSSAAEFLVDTAK